MELNYEIKNGTKKLVRIPAIGYVRLSTEGQDSDDRYGEDAQKSAILKWCRENGYEIVAWIKEVGSGAKERPMLESIVYGTAKDLPDFQALIVYKNDRIARDTKLYFTYLYFLDKQDIKLISTQEEFETEGEFANVYRALLQFVAEQERKNITARTSAGRMMKANKGQYSGGRFPFGYKVNGGLLEVDAEDKHIVRYIFALRSKGLSWQRIADWLNGRNVYTKSGKPFQARSIGVILANERFYRGEYKYGNNDWKQGAHEPILSTTPYVYPDIEELAGSDWDK